jgi:hypothetical protein
MINQFSCWLVIPLGTTGKACTATGSGAYFIYAIRLLLYLNIAINQIKTLSHEINHALLPNTA